jgi:hypothetical protein
VVWGGIRLWRSLMRLDLIDEFQLSMYPYIANEGTLLFDDVPKSYRLDLISSTAPGNGVVELRCRRYRSPASPPSGKEAVMVAPSVASRTAKASTPYPDGSAARTQVRAAQGRRRATAALTSRVHGRLRDCPAA